MFRCALKLPEEISAARQSPCRCAEAARYPSNSGADTHCLKPLSVAEGFRVFRPEILENSDARKKHMKTVAMESFCLFEVILCWMVALPILLIAFLDFILGEKILR